MGYAWTYLWVMANWKDGHIHFRNETIPIKRGERITSFIKLGKQFGWDRKKVKKFFILLEKEQMLTYRTTNRYVRYKVCEYDKYQKKQKDMPTERPTATPTGGQQTTQQLPTNNKEYKVNKEYKGGADFFEKKSALPKSRYSAKRISQKAREYAERKNKERNGGDKK